VIDVLAFWLVCLVVGALTLPVTFAVFRRMPDGGAGLAMPLGLLLAGYGYFVLRIIGVLQQGRGGYVAVLVLLAVVNLAVAGRDRRFRATSARSWPGVMIAAGLFTLAFFAYVTFRSYNPDIAGTEQPMDFMYLNAMLESPDYPPHDPWLAGEPASYYYFGYLQAGLLTGASGVAPSVGYNLSLAYTFAASAVGVAALSLALARWSLGRRARRFVVVAAVLGPLLLLGVGSLSAAFEWAAAHGHYNRALLDALGLEWMIPCANGVRENCFTGNINPRTTEWYPTEYWFWWRGSRIIPNTITEFPFFSFLLGDLHPHVMSIPPVLVSLAISSVAWRGRDALSWRTHRARPAAGFLVALVGGGLAFQNAWDVLTFSGVFAVVVVIRNLRRTHSTFALLDSVTYLAPLGLVAVVAYAPWYLDFSSQASGFFPYIGAGTRPGHALVQFGVLIAASLTALAWCVHKEDRSVVVRTATFTLWVPLVPLFIWVAFAGYRGEYTRAVDARGSGGWVTLTVYGLTVWVLTTAFVALAVARRPSAPVLGLGALGALLLFGAELFFIGDIFIGGVPRLNTVFKLTYQAWILFSVAGAVALAGSLARVRRVPSAAWLAAPALGLMILGLAYPLTALPSRTGNFDGTNSSIDGLAFLARNDPAEYALQQWVRKNTAPEDIIIEASGRTWRRDSTGQPTIAEAGVDYTDAGRIAARTGRQSPIGWYFHEIQWRGDTPEVRTKLTARQDLVDAVYTATSASAVVAAMHASGATYLVVGSVERSRYTGLMPDFAAFLDTAFDTGDLSGRSAQVFRLPDLTTTRDR
jgi:YYY domain-containing protein